MEACFFIPRDIQYNVIGCCSGSIVLKHTGILRGKNSVSLFKSFMKVIQKVRFEVLTAANTKVTVMPNSLVETHRRGREMCNLNPRGRTLML